MSLGSPELIEPKEIPNSFLHETAWDNQASCLQSHFNVAWDIVDASGKKVSYDLKKMGDS
jgi:hypothetical protein